jgi:4,5-DOPA dioxygenase extradiol
MDAIPSLFISHGGPNIVISDTAARRHLETLSTLVPRPEAIVIVSAHFETEGVAVVTDPAPSMIYDFGGFPQQLYELRYPAPGDPRLAEEVFALLDRAGLQPARIGSRGYDHGTWTPLLLAFPNADIPVVQVSIDPSRNAEWHYRLGRALSPLREQGVLLIGSGHITHNLRAFFSMVREGEAADPALPGKVEAFTTWFAETLAAGDTEALLAWKERAPFAVDNHPTDEHLMPIFFAYGAGGDEPRATRVHDSVEHGFFANDSYLFQSPSVTA